MVAAPDLRLQGSQLDRHSVPQAHPRMRSPRRLLGMGPARLPVGDASLGAAQGASVRRPALRSSEARCQAVEGQVPVRADLHPMSASAWRCEAKERLPTACGLWCGDLRRCSSSTSCRCPQRTGDARGLSRHDRRCCGPLRNSARAPAVKATTVVDDVVDDDAAS